MNSEELAQKEKDLFLDLSRWLILEATVTGKSRITWLRFFLAHCVDEVSLDLEKELIRAFKIVHPIFLEGEQALCEIVDNLCFTSTSQTTLSHPSKHTDWAKSLSKSPSGILTRFIDKPRKNRYHAQLLSALFRLIGDQLSILETFCGGQQSIEGRMRRLKAAAKKLQNHASNKFDNRQRFTKEIKHHLFIGYPHQAVRVSAMLSFLHDELDPITDATAFQSFLERIAHIFVAENSDHLLEVICRLAIAKVAYDEGFKIEKIVTENSRSKKELTVEMRNAEGVPFLISKGRRFIKENTQSNDLSSQIQNCGRAMGDFPSGLEPDICIKFNDRIFLGDAKRNPTGDGRAYRASSIKTCASYLLEYKNEIENSHPKLTLFFLQGGSKIANITRDYIERDGLPDCRQIPIIGLGLDQDDFEGAVIMKWFQKISA